MGLGERFLRVGEGISWVDGGELIFFMGAWGWLGVGGGIFWVDMGGSTFFMGRWV